jgi:hypothetical protein
MDIDVRVESVEGALPRVDFRWDVDTDILTATLRTTAVGEGMSGSVEVTGSDGSWLIFDVNAGRIAGVEVAVWPDVRTVEGLVAPAAPADARVSIPTRRSQPGVAAVEVETRLTAESDTAEKTIHFRIGGARATRAIRLADDLLLDIDEREQIAGVWFLNVPPFPAEKQ